jgi:probable biosynthetic protein (TIGR04098 family)
MKRTVQVGMPQMALGFLSENWLLKELGDLHWDKLCNSLQRKSNDLVDSQGRRLYATLFVYASSSTVR